MSYRLALVTGATSGIGREVCKLFAQKGIDLILSGRNEEQLLILQKSLSKQVSVQTFQADLSQAKGRSRLIVILHERVPDIVINNAGCGLYGEALSYPTSEQADLLEVNGKAVLELTLEAARAMISREKKGVVLNISSAAAFQVFPFMAVYSASKAFVNHFSQSMDFELKRYGVRVLTLCPGMVATEFQTRAGGRIEGQQKGLMSASFVAKQIWRQIERLNPLLIIDWKYRLLTFFASFAPKSWIAAAEERIISSRITPRTIIKVKK